MKIKGQHGESNSGDGAGETKREIEIEEGERIGIVVKYREGNPIKEDEVISFFMPGKLTLIWKKNK